MNFKKTCKMIGNNKKALKSHLNAIEANRQKLNIEQNYMYTC